MSSTILMAIVLVVMWLVVLVPMFVRRGDERTETRSMDRFATAMRVLSRRSPGSGGVARRRPYATVTPTPYADGASPVRAAARAEMMRRRRRTLGMLAVTALLALPASLLVSGWLWLVEASAVLLLASYIGWLRQQVRREQERRRRRAVLFGEPARTVPSGGAEHLARRPRATGSRPVPAGVAEAPAERDRSWRSVPVPPPTYVTAPVVRRPETLVDLDDEDLSFADLDPRGDLLDRPRAVNE
ncbi:MAG: hypothetical protein ACJ73E_09995 [Mycobacteriales bacterium]